MATQECNQERTMPILCVCVGGGGRSRSFTDSLAISIVLINLPTFYQQFSFLSDISLSFTNEMLLLTTHPGWYALSSTLFFDTSAFLLARKHNLQPNNAQSDKRTGTSGKAVFHFNRIIAKRNVFRCFLNTQAELMT